MPLKFYGKTDIGQQRAENQDCFGIYPITDDTTLCVVCDGMGGHAAGATASVTARDRFADAVKKAASAYLKKDESQNGENSLEKPLNKWLDFSTMKKTLERGVEAANRAVWDASNLIEGLEGMGTTLVAVLIREQGSACCVSVGDSRIYNITSTAIEQITHDHSYVQHLVDVGQLTAEQAKVSPMRNVITRAVGIGDTVRSDISSADISRPADGKRYILLCTDGLTGSVNDEIIFTLINDNATIEQKADGLIGLANGAGGHDNITVLLIEF